MHTDTPAITRLGVTNVNYSENSSTVDVEWSSKNQTLKDSMDFRVEITPPPVTANSSMSIFSTCTSSRSYSLTIPYNSQHTITVSATNCVGNTSTFKTTFNFGKL